MGWEEENSRSALSEPPLARLRGRLALLWSRRVPWLSVAWQAALLEVGLVSTWDSMSAVPLV